MNKYANLDGTKKIKDEFGKINTGFDGVDADLTAHLNDVAPHTGATNLVKTDGSNPMTGNLNMGNKMLINLGASDWKLRGGTTSTLYFERGGLAHTVFRISFDPSNGQIQGPVTFNDGNPTFTFTSDPNTGIAGGREALPDVLHIITGGIERLRVDATGHTLPGSDNASNLGSASRRFKEVFAGTGTINTSDANEKEQIEPLSLAEINVAQALKGLIKKFKYKDAVLEKGTGARIHVGVIAQDVRNAFIAQGLDAHDYGIFCEDTWWEKEVLEPTLVANPNFDANIEESEENPRLILGEPIPRIQVLSEYEEGATERTRLGIRYEELLAFVIAGL